SASSASASTTKTAWLERTSGSGEPPKTWRSSSPSDSQSSRGSAEKSVSLLDPPGAGSRYTATPALSGPRSDICSSIAPRCRPSDSSISADLANSPTIPHICHQVTLWNTGDIAWKKQFSQFPYGGFLHS